MDFASLGKKLLPHLLIMAIFLAVSSMVLSPVLSGKVMKQHDINMFSGSFQEVDAYYQKTGERSLWTNSMFGGMPTYQIAPYSPNNMLGTAWLFSYLVSGSIPKPINVLLFYITICLLIAAGVVLTNPTNYVKDKRKAMNMIILAVVVGVVVCLGIIYGQISLPRPLNVPFLYCISFYFLMLAFGINPWLAMLGGLAYAFSSFNVVILEAGHMLQAYALATGPMVLAAAIFTIRSKKYIFGGSLFALAMALHLRCNHPQMTYYFMLILAIYLLVEFIFYIKENQIPTIVKSIVAIGIGAMLAFGTYMTSFLTTNEYAKQSTRGQSELTAKTQSGDRGNERNASGLNMDYAFGYSYGVGETFTLMIPDFRGGKAAAVGNEHRDVIKGTETDLRQQVLSMDEYWGEDSGGGPYYFGAIICFLFVLGMIFLKSHYRWWILAVTVLGMMLSWGKNFMDFNEFVFNHVPYYDKFRSVNFTLFMSAVAVPILAILALNKVLEGIEWNKQTKRRLIIAFACTGGLCLIFFIIPSLAGDFLKPNDIERSELAQQKAPQQTIDLILGALQEARQEILQADAIRSFILILLAGAIIWFYSMKWQFFGGKSGKQIAIVSITVLILFDQVGVVKRYVSDKNFEAKKTVSFEPTEADNYIMRDPDPDYRVLNLSLDPNSPMAPFNDASTSYFHKSIGGYHGAKIRRFQELAEKYLYNESGILLQNAGKMPPLQLMPALQASRKISILDMMNCKYIMASTDTSGVIRNPYALGHVWFVKGIKVVQSADDEIAALDGFNPADTAVIDEGPKHPEFKTYMEGFTPRPDPTASIKLDEYKPNYLKYSSHATTEQFAVFSEAYYDNSLGWDVFVDGQKQAHVRANYILRGMRVPAGNHTIEFKFEPQSFAKGERIAMITSLLMLIGLVGSAGWEIWRSGKKEDEVEKPEEEVE